MSSKKKTDTQLPPLLPLEYCSVARAARLLGCEEEDIYHWREIGAIKLCAVLNGENCKAFVKPDFLYGELEPEAIKNMKLEEELAKVHEPGEGENFQMDEGHVIGSGPMEIDESLLNPMVVYDAVADGVWIEADDDTMEISGPNLVSSSKTEHVGYEGGLKNAELVGIQVPDLQNRLVVMKSDLDKLHKAIHGLAPLPNRHNDSDIAAEMAAKEKEAQAIASSRVSAPQKLIIQELAKKVLDVDEIENPHKMAEALLLEIPQYEEARRKIGQDKDVKRSVARWLGAK
ncbi:MULTISPECIES: hypothetical protein [unclassified Salinivibrio]|uniref:hypothetical protein n=1 Tax=unclassified Salinivibrio TaxID=2636825 RepID=UPI0009875845|nr:MULTISPECIES: hypothetical protein [unclassified Salinivibrio]OOF10260.1 hypothetical protein BZG83_14150 [Salinivibrio sp. PR919]OOF18513.1 hypothetical protein BZG84_03455 [Salinivibrio sp. PR932]